MHRLWRGVWRGFSSGVWLSRRIGVRSRFAISGKEFLSRRMFIVIWGPRASGQRNQVGGGTRHFRRYISITLFDRPQNSSRLILQFFVSSEEKAEHRVPQRGYYRSLLEYDKFCVTRFLIINGQRAGRDLTRRPPLPTWSACGSTRSDRGSCGRWGRLRGRFARSKLGSGEVASGTARRTREATGSGRDGTCDTLPELVSDSQDEHDGHNHDEWYLRDSRCSIWAPFSRKSETVDIPIG